MVGWPARLPPSYSLKVVSLSLSRGTPPISDNVSGARVTRDDGGALVLGTLRTTQPRST